VIAPPAPHLNEDAIRGIGMGFLQIQREVVSALILQKDNTINEELD
jgi:hypothetical protein